MKQAEISPFYNQARLTFCLFSVVTTNYKLMILENPYENGAKWEIEIEHFVKTGKLFSSRARKDHLDYMLNIFSKENSTNQKK